MRRHDPDNNERVTDIVATLMRRPCKGARPRGGVLTDIVAFTPHVSHYPFLLVLI